MQTQLNLTQTLTWVPFGHPGGFTLCINPNKLNIYIELLELGGVTHKGHLVQALQ